MASALTSGGVCSQGMGGMPRILWTLLVLGVVGNRYMYTLPTAHPIG